MLSFAHGAVSRSVPTTTLFEAGVAHGFGERTVESQVPSEQDATEARLLVLSGRVAIGPVRKTADPEHRRPETPGKGERFPAASAPAAVAPAFLS